MLTARTRAHLMLVVAAAIWGFAFVAQALGAEYTGPMTFNGVRFGLGALSLLPLVAVLDRRGGPDRSRARSAWRPCLLPGLLAGTVLFVAALLQQSGMSTTSAGKASFITGLYIVLVPIAGILLGHRTSRATWAAVLVALIGLYLLCVTEGLSIAPGDVLMLGSAVFFTGHILVIDRYARLDALRLSVTQFGTCALLNLVGAGLLEETPYAGIDRALVPILYGGLVSVGIAYTLQVFGQRDALPAHAALIMSLESVFGLLGGALLLAESMTPRGYAGCALMLAGIVLSQLGAPPGQDPVAPSEPTALPVTTPHRQPPDAPPA